MQGVIVTPSGDVWVVGLSKNQLVFFPKGDLTKAKLVCEGESAEPCKSFKGAFHLGIDQQDRIWVSNSGVDHVTRFPASDPSKAENFKTGINNSGLAIDSGGDVWVTNRFGTGLLGVSRRFTHHMMDFGRHMQHFFVEIVGLFVLRQKISPKSPTDEAFGHLAILRR